MINIWNLKPVHAKINTWGPLHLWSKHKILDHPICYSVKNRHLFKTSIFTYKTFRRRLKWIEIICLKFKNDSNRENISVVSQLTYIIISVRNTYHFKIIESTKVTQKILKIKSFRLEEIIYKVKIARRSELAHITNCASLTYNNLKRLDSLNQRTRYRLSKSWSKYLGMECDLKDLLYPFCR